MLIFLFSFSACCTLEMDNGDFLEQKPTSSNDAQAKPAAPKITFGFTKQLKSKVVAASLPKDNQPDVNQDVAVEVTHMKHGLING